MFVCYRLGSRTWPRTRQAPAACNTSSWCPQHLDVSWYLINQDRQFSFTGIKVSFFFSSFTVKTSEHTDFHKSKNRSFSSKQHVAPQDASTPGFCCHTWSRFCTSSLMIAFQKTTASIMVQMHKNGYTITFLSVGEIWLNLWSAATLIVRTLAYIMVIMFGTGLMLFCRISCPSKLFQYSIIMCSYLVLLGDTKMLW